MKLREIEPILPDYVGYKIGLPIGYLMPVNSYIEWRFSRKEDVADSVNEMADAVIKYGFPYLKELSDRDNVIYGLEIRKYRGVQEFQLPVFHYLNGNIKRALDCIDENIKKYLAPHLEEYEIDILKKLAEDNGEVYTANNNALNAYLEFADNFKKMVGVDKDNNAMDK